MREFLDLIRGLCILVGIQVETTTKNVRTRIIGRLLIGKDPHEKHPK